MQIIHGPGFTETDALDQLAESVHNIDVQMTQMANRSARWL